MQTSRRLFLKRAALAAVPGLARAAGSQVLGQGEHRYQVVSGWGVLDSATPVKNCHGIVRDREGHIVLLTDDTTNNIIIYDKQGRLVSKWGTEFPGAHGLSIIPDGDREILFITCLRTHRVCSFTLDGKMLNEWKWPEQTGKYEKEDQYKPSWTLHLPDGGFFVLDGYGLDFITHYDAAGKFVCIFGGQEGGIQHWGPHGGMLDLDKEGKPSLLIAMSDQQHLLRLSTTGEKVGKTDLPGGNPRQIRKHEGHYYIAHLADNWPADRASRGFVSVLDTELKVLSNIAGTAPFYDDQGKLQKMAHKEEVFIHPHDLVVDDEGSIYVAQFNSGNTYPIKLERV